MNTGPGKEELQPDHTVRFRTDLELSSEVDDALASVTRDLERERERRGEERFFWICAIVIIADLFIFPTMQTWSAPLAIVFIQFLFLVPLGRKLGVDSIWTLTEKLLDKWDGRTGL